MNYRGLAKGMKIELEEPLPFPEGQAVRVSVEPCTSASRVGSPPAVLQAVRDFPHLHAVDLDELEAALESARLPVHAGIVLNEGK
ncbi:MAG: hypothetical protein HY298_26070 [Verrucomicrobia bacterium]|nr:hypothetical protein [Verrucomicrobiota bacterium]